MRAHESFDSDLHLETRLSLSRGSQDSPERVQGSEDSPDRVQRSSGDFTSPQRLEMSPALSEPQRLEMSPASVSSGLELSELDRSSSVLDHMDLSMSPARLELGLHGSDILEDEIREPIEPCTLQRFKSPIAPTRKRIRSGDSHTGLTQDITDILRLRKRSCPNLMVQGKDNYSQLAHAQSSGFLGGQRIQDHSNEFNSTERTETKLANLETKMDGLERISESESNIRSMSGNEPISGSESGSKSGNKSRSESGSNSGSKSMSGSESGSKSGSESGSNSGSKSMSGSESGSNSGSKSMPGSECVRDQTLSTCSESSDGSGGSEKVNIQFKLRKENSVFSII